MTLWFVVALTAISTDCTAVVGLASSLGMTGPTFSTLTEDCCNPSVGVTCVNNFVTEISWVHMGLSGTLTGSGLPNGLKVLNLKGNDIQGSISLINNLPSGLITINLNSNRIIGNLNTVTSSPSNIQNFDFGGNAINGNMVGIPNTMITFNLTGNQITGSIQNIPATLISFEMGKNQLSGAIPALPAYLQVLDLSNNELVGSLPVLPSTLTIIVLNDNLLNGAVIVNAPTILNIGNNQFTSISVANASNLQPDSCDLGNTFIDYTQVGMLYNVCNTFGLAGSTYLHTSKTTTKISTSSIASASTKTTSLSMSTTILKSHSTTSTIFASTTMLASSSSTSSNFAITPTTTSSSTVSIKQTSSVLVHTTIWTKTTSSSSVIIPPIPTSLIFFKTSAPVPQSIVASLLSTGSVTTSTREKYPWGSSTKSTLQISHSNETDFSFFDFYSSISTAAPNESEFVPSLNPDLDIGIGIYLAVGGLFLSVILTIAAGIYFKNPTINSKFARKNSFATLQTYTTKGNKKGSISTVSSPMSPRHDGNRF